jgi:hypothetical protein
MVERKTVSATENAEEQARQSGLRNEIVATLAELCALYVKEHPKNVTQAQFYANLKKRVEALEALEKRENDESESDEIDV